MKPDLFIDADISGHIMKPLDDHYRDLIKWLYVEGCLVICRSLHNEYRKAVRESPSLRTLPAIVDRLTRARRLIRYSREELRGFRIKERIVKRLLSNRSDHDYIKIVMMSDRRLALSGDNKLRRDINNFPRYGAQAYRHPGDFDYRDRTC